jgi:hypothetical protein
MPRKVYPYHPEYAEQARKLALLGATNADIVDFFGITMATLQSWERRYPEFHRQLELGRAAADANVADSLYRRATGFRRKVQKAFQHQGTPVVVETEEDVQPDTIAGIFWLKNRRRDVWKDRHEHQVDPGAGLIGLLSALNQPKLVRDPPKGKRRARAKPGAEDVEDADG